jgi:hypothetical protein
VNVWLTEPRRQRRVTAESAVGLDCAMFYRESKWLTVLYVVIPAAGIFLALVIPAIRRWLSP